MIFTEINSSELQTMQNKENYRYFFPQSAEYTDIKNNTLKKILAVKNENNEIIAYGIFIYFKFKKIFFKAVAQYGPVMDYNNKKLVDFYFSQLKNYFKKDYRVLSIIVNPFVYEKIYKDIEYISENEDAIYTKEKLTNLGFYELNDDLFTNPILATRCTYSKQLTEDITEQNLLKNISQMARYTINKTIKEGVLVREIDIFNNNDAKIFDEINRDTENRINFAIRDNNYFKSLKNVMKDKLHLLISYIDCDLFINKTNETILKLENERENLSEKLEQGKVNSKKTSNKIKELDENITIWYKKIDKIKELKEQEGNIINLSCASFIESGQDLIYFTSGAVKKFHRFEGPYAVLYHMLNFSIKNKFKYFNFFGTSKNFISEEATDYSVLQFKRNFNGNIEYFMDNYELRNNLGKFLKI